MCQNQVKNAYSGKLWTKKWYQTIWDEIPFYYAGIENDEFTVMPNHMYGIVVIVGATPLWLPCLNPAWLPCFNPAWLP